MAVKKKRKKSPVKKAAKKPIKKKSVKAAPKKKKKKKKKKKAARKRKRGKGGVGGWLALVLMVAAAVAVFVGLKHFQGAPQVDVAVRSAGVMGSKGKGPGNLNSPRGLAVGPQGQVAVADLGNSRINVYDASGKFKFSFGQLGQADSPNLPGDFREPSGVAIDSQGNFYVADAWNGRIQRFDSKGKFLQEYGKAPYNFYSPRNVAVDGRGNIYVADTGNSQIKIFPIRGGKPIAIGGAGKGDGQFKEVFGVAINSQGEILATDPGNKRIQKFSPAPSSKVLASVKIPGWKNGGPFWPHITVDRQDRVYVADNVNNKIWMYDKNLKYLATLGGAEGQLPFGSPLGLAVSRAGDLLVGDMNGNRIVKLAPIRLPVKP